MYLLASSAVIACAILRIAISDSDIETVGDVVAAGVDLNPDVIPHRLNNGFHRLATTSLDSVQLVLLDEWLERTSAGDHLSDTGQLTRHVVFGAVGNDRGRKIGRSDNDERLDS